MTRLFSAAAVAVLAAVWPAHPVGASGPCPPLDYVAGVGRAAADLNATPPDTSAAAAELRHLVASYPAAQETLTPIVARLGADPPQLDGAGAALRSLAGTLALPQGSTCNADQRPARAALDQVYGSPVFANLDKKPPGPNPISQLLSWLGSLLRNVTGALGAAGTGAVAGVLLLGALGLAVWRLRASLGGRPARVSGEPRGDTADPTHEWARAEDAAARGEYREATRRAFRSALLAVAVRGRLTVDPAWTTQELLAATAGDAGLLAALAPAADSFDRAWYSGAPVSQADWERARGRCEAVRALAGSRGRAGAP